MKDALTNTYAAAQAPGPRLARLARRGLAVCMLACVGLGAAQAQNHGRRDDVQLPPPPSMRGDRFAPPPPQIEQPREQRVYEQQQRAMDEQQRRQAAQLQYEQSARDGRRGGRLTPDERRDLRRQINEAGVDIYPNAQRR
ncbi:hypothetical protein [Massilia sp.]|uniref:hypothetical protein n=1 Tax=Massilia sp. TaxID=1882437 RepID=UPI0028AB02D4|nr:hypothetical protein [Massilia sp.]